MRDGAASARTAPSFWQAGCVCWLALLVFAAVPVSLFAQPPSGRLGQLSLEELATLDVTSVSRRAERLADAPASIFVITAEEIRRSGATTLAEALRLAPHLQVARLDAAQYAISVRGFNSAIANKLLVLIDGRTIYTPLFSGVFWDQQDLMLQDVERIEIISGPGATLWGANAVNGVINVITRPARDTTGAAAFVSGDGAEQMASFRYGATLAGSGTYRVYAKASRLDETESAAQRLRDARNRLQVGGRAEWGGGASSALIQGDAYASESVDRGTVAGFALGRVQLSGFNILGRISREYGDGRHIQGQAYFQRYRRRERVLFQPTVNLADLELQHGSRHGRHQVLVGGGYRRAHDEVADGILVAVRPTSRSLDWGSVFVEDQIALSDALTLSLGLKLERNDYTGWERLPTVRAAWKARPEHLVWGSVARAVRAPARLDRDVRDPFGIVLGGPMFQSEVSRVVEGGYRGQLVPAVTSSVTLFRHDWIRLRSGTAPPVVVENGIRGPVYGIEAWSTWQATPFARVTGGVTAFRKRLALESWSTDPVGVDNPQLANDPSHQWMIRPALTIGRHDIDLSVRHVASLPHPEVPAYRVVDMRYGWHPRLDLELAVRIGNLLDHHHAEFGVAPSRTVFGRRSGIQLTWYP